MWECRGDTGGFSGYKAAKPVTVVQICRSWFVDIFKVTSGQFPAVFVVSLQYD